MYQTQTVTANISKQYNSGSLSKRENNHFRPVVPDATELHGTHQLQRFAWHEQPPLQLVHIDWIRCVFLCVKVQRVRQNKLARFAESKEHMPGRYRERKKRGKYIIFIYKYHKINVLLWIIIILFKLIKGWTVTYCINILFFATMFCK